MSLSNLVSTSLQPLNKQLILMLIGHRDRQRIAERGREESILIRGCPPGIRTPICRSRGGCPTIERGGNKGFKGLELPLVWLPGWRRAQQANPFIICGFARSGQTLTATSAARFHRASGVFPSPNPSPEGRCAAPQKLSVTLRGALRAAASQECGSSQSILSPSPAPRYQPAQSASRSTPGDSQPQAA